MATAMVTACAGDDGSGDAVDDAAAPETTAADEPDEPDAVEEPDELDGADEPDEVEVDESEVDEPDEPDDVDDPDTTADVGLAWERVDDDPRVFGSVPPVVTALGAGVDRFVAVGRARDGSRALLLWTSTDGRTWTVADGSVAFGGVTGESTEIRRIVARGNGFVAIGIEAVESEDAATAPTTTTAPAAPNAPDPDSLSEFADPDADDGSIEVDDSPEPPAAAGTRIRGAVWTSDDGATWERVVAGAAPFDAEGNVVLRAVAPGGPGLVAVGSIDEGAERHGAVWVSNDGTGWLRVPHDPAVFGEAGVTSIEGLAVGVDRIVAVGVAPGIGRETRGAVWVSDDGVEWRAVADDPTLFGGVGTSVRINAVTAGGPGFVAVGSERILAGGAVRFDASIWWSSDGERWERVDPDDDALVAADSQVLWDVITLDDRLVAVGGADGSGAVWVSDDGERWERLAVTGDVFGASGATQVQQVVALGDLLAASGVSDEIVPLWSSPPLVD